jgi:DNA-binding transcriptional MerR regulator
MKQETNTLLEMGTSAFCTAAEISQTTARNLEYRGIIAPRRTASGWRIYTETELEAVRQWKNSK